MFRNVPGFFLVVIFLLTGLGCKSIGKSASEKEDQRGQIPFDLHWGTKYNTLRGVTVSWFSVSVNDSFSWGYTNTFKEGKYAAERSDAGRYYLYEYTFPPLKPLSRLFFEIKSGQNWGKTRLYNTQQDTLSNNFCFIVGSDCHGGDDDHDSDSRWKIMSKLMQNENCDFYIFSGDIVDDDNDWDLWHTYYKNGQILLENKLVFYSWGNHEYGPIALQNVVLPGNEKWYSFEKGNALFISLLTEEDFDHQHQWLIDVLHTTEKEWIIVYFHRPFFTRGSHKGEMNDKRSTWWKTFDDYGVDIVMSGHTHSYIRTKPLNLNISDTSAVGEYGSKPGQGRMAFVLAGSGGRNSRASNDWFTAKAYSGLHYVKFTVDRKKLHFDTFTDQGVVIDSLTLFKGFN